MIRAGSVGLVLAALAVAASSQPAAAPVVTDESLTYAINWPNGSSLGEATLRVHETGTSKEPAWNSSFEFNAPFPGFSLADKFTSKARTGVCTEKFVRDQRHGGRESGETIEVNAQSHEATRKPKKGGGESTLPVPDCVRDPIAMLIDVQRELREGHVPKPESVLFGSLYDVQFSELGEATITQNSQAVPVTRVGCRIKGPASEYNIEIDFAKDALRTPVKVKLPFAAGTFSVELER